MSQQMLSDDSHLGHYLATTCFALAVIHTFLTKRFQHQAQKYRAGSTAENIFHLVGEIEVVFGLWSGIYILTVIALQGRTAAIEYLNSLNFTEPAFVFVILVVCATKPVLSLVERIIFKIAKILPLKPGIAFYATSLVVGPLLGSFITEPAAMTVTALLLLNNFYKKSMSHKLMYATIGLLFVNVSVGGTLTPYAAPPVLLVAGKWNWDAGFMFLNLGWKAILAVVISTAVVTYRFRQELSQMPSSKIDDHKMPIWISVIHLIILALVVASSHYMVVFIFLFLFFLGLATVTKEYQNGLRIREGLLVGFFLGGLVILGGPQRWWLEPLLGRLNSMDLYLSSMGLTAITDNAALTYLGSQVPSLSEASKYALVAGSVVGGGLTVIANAPNPVGYGILNSSFGEEGINPIQLLKAALLPTSIAAICFWPY
jgi:hypothetical protein